LENKYFKTSLSLNAKELKKEKLDEYDVDVHYNEQPISGNIKSYYTVSITEMWNKEETDDNPKKKPSQKMLENNIHEALFVKYSLDLVKSKYDIYINTTKLEKDNFVIGEPEKRQFVLPIKEGQAEVNLEYVNYKSNNKSTIISYRVDNGDVKTHGFDKPLKNDIPDLSSWLIYVDSEILNASADSFRNLSLDGLDEDLTTLKKSSSW
jgi:hypothetical protein